jgi:hypothetical protein
MGDLGVTTWTGSEVRGWKHGVQGGKELKSSGGRPGARILCILRAGGMVLK